MQSKKDFLDNASEQYYKGKPIITDDEFDRLAQSINYNAGMKSDGSFEEKKN